MISAGVLQRNREPVGICEPVTALAERHEVVENVGRFPVIPEVPTRSDVVNVQRGRVLDLAAVLTGGVVTPASLARLREPIGTLQRYTATSIGGVRFGVFPQVLVPAFRATEADALPVYAFPRHRKLAPALTTDAYDRGLEKRRDRLALLGGTDRRTVGFRPGRPLGEGDLHSLRAVALSTPLTCTRAVRPVAHDLAATAFARALNDAGAAGHGTESGLIWPEGFAAARTLARARIGLHRRFLPLPAGGVTSAARHFHTQPNYTPAGGAS